MGPPRLSLFLVSARAPFVPDLKKLLSVIGRAIAESLRSLLDCKMTRLITSALDESCQPCCDKCRHSMNSRKHWFVAHSGEHLWLGSAEPPFAAGMESAGGHKRQLPLSYGFAM